MNSFNLQLIRRWIHKFTAKFRDSTKSQPSTTRSRERMKRLRIEIPIRSLRRVECKRGSPQRETFSLSSACSCSQNICRVLPLSNAMCVFGLLLEGQFLRYRNIFRDNQLWSSRRTRQWIVLNSYLHYNNCEFIAVLMPIVSHFLSTADEMVPVTIRHNGKTMKKCRIRTARTDNKVAVPLSPCLFFSWWWEQVNSTSCTLFPKVINFVFLIIFCCSSSPPWPFDVRRGSKLEISFSRIPHVHARHHGKAADVLSVFKCWQWMGWRDYFNGAASPEQEQMPPRVFHIQ